MIVLLIALIVTLFRSRQTGVRVYRAQERRAPAPGAARLAHRAAQPGARSSRSPTSDARAGRAATTPGGRRVPGRPRRVQRGQRHLRAPGRRPGAPSGGRASLGAHRNRPTRSDGSGRRVRRRWPSARRSRAASRCSPNGSSRQLAAPFELARGSATGVHRAHHRCIGRGQRPRRDSRRGPVARRRHRAQRGQGVGAAPLHRLRAGHAHGRPHPAGDDRRAADGASSRSSSSSPISRSSLWRAPARSGWRRSLRWRHPLRGVVPPLEFIPLLEETGMIVDVGREVLRLGLRAGQAVGAPRPPHLRLGQRLGHPARVRAVLPPTSTRPCRRAGLEPGRASPSRSPRARSCATPTDTVRRLANLKALGHQPRHRRLRDRVLLARLPAPVPGRHLEDRPLVRRRHDRPRPAGWPSCGQCSSSPGPST